MGGEVNGVSGSDPRKYDDHHGAPPPPEGGAKERAERAAAEARYHAFTTDPEHHVHLDREHKAERRKDPDECGRWDLPYHDYEKCTGPEVKNPSLFEKQDKDVDAVDANDVRQVGLGDCALMASLASLASLPDGQSLIHDAIKENKNDEGETVSYTVRLYQRDAHWPHALHATYVTVDGDFSEGHAAARPAGDKSEVWPLVMERAYEQLKGGANAIGHGGSPKDAMEALTGHDATYVVLGVPTLFDNGGYSQSDMKSDMKAQRLVVLSTKDDVGMAHGLDGNHAYQLAGYTEHDGKIFLLLHDPRNSPGTPDPEPVPFDELHRFFDAVDVGTAR
jgi:hypothetical protein